MSVKGVPNRDTRAAAEERDRLLVKLVYEEGMSASEAGRSLDPPQPGKYVNIRMTARRKQGWDIPRKSQGPKVDWDLAQDLKDEGVSSERIAKLFDVHEGTIEYGRINKKKPRRSSIIDRSRLRRPRW